jgi:hypothetical protein
MIYTFSATDTTALIGYIGGVVGDFLPVILIVLAVSIGLFIVSKVFHL